MTADLPAGPRGRILAFALTAAVAGAIWAGIVAPLLGWFDSRAERLTEQRVLVARMAAVANDLPELRRAAGAAAARGPSAGPMLDGATDSVAAATLQELVQGMAGKAGATFSSIETLPAEASGGYRRIALRVALSTHYATVVGLLRACAEATPRLLVDDIHVLTSQMIMPMQPGGLGRVDRTTDMPMDVSFTVIAFRPVDAAARP